jgi:DNA polymerase-3 subunit beta
MKLEIQREQLLRPLQQAIGVVERRQTLPILSNVLLVAEAGELALTATDLEVEIVAKTSLTVHEPGQITCPGRKLLDILRALPDGVALTVSTQDAKLLIRSGRSRFSLVTLPASDFPNLEDLPFDQELSIRQDTLKTLIERTYFAMAQQDVRYYLNGLLLEMAGQQIRAVATDGHRLALREVALESELPVDCQVIIPRKGIQELLRLLNDLADQVLIRVGDNHIQVSLGDICFTSKLIDGKFPDYHRVVPREGERSIIADRMALRSAMARVAILSNEKYRGIRIHTDEGVLRLQAHNPEQEEAEEEIAVTYSGESLEIGFNVAYLLDALGALSGDKVKITFTDASSSCLIQEAEGHSGKYVVMPMRL